MDFAFVRIDGHMVCQHGAFNSSRPRDPGKFRLLSKQANLAITAEIYHTKPSLSPVGVAVQWCAQGVGCQPLPAVALSSALPPPEQQARALQRGMASGWGSWLHRDALSIALLPDSAVITIMLCRISTGECLRGKRHRP